jgi:hypothetical protein
MCLSTLIEREKVLGVDTLRIDTYKVSAALWRISFRMSGPNSEGHEWLDPPLGFALTIITSVTEQAQR